MKHFKRKEFECKCGCGFDTVDYELVAVLEDLRDFFDFPITINSGCRCLKHNAEIRGSEKSQHLYGKAVDLVVKNVHEDLVYRYLNNKYSTNYGIGRYDGRTHIDVRSKRARWDKRRHNAN